MNPKFIFGFSGLVLGASIGYIIGSQITKTRLNDIHEEEILSIKVAFENRKNPLRDKLTESKLEKSIETVKVQETEVTNDTLQMVDDYMRYIEESHPYSEDINEFGSPEEEDNKNIEVSTSTGFEYIDFDAFLEFEEDYDFSDLYYLASTEEISSEDDDDIFDKKESYHLVGELGMHKLKIGDFKDDALYVVNHARKTLYTVYMAEE